jgi:hypothetical protein
MFSVGSQFFYCVGKMTHEIDKAMDLMCNELCEKLPQDWMISIDFEEGGLAIKLINPEGEDVAVEDDDMPVSQMIMMRVNLARQTDGLAPAYDDLDTDPSWNFKCD